MSPGPALPLDRSARLIATAGLMVASAMQAADATIVNVALPRLEHDLGASVVLGSWVVTSYLCATAVVAPLTGWLRRRIGTRRLFAGTVAAFAAASLLCALAPSPAAIILFRILQGAGGGAIHPLAQSILLDLYPRRKHGRMLALWGATVMVGPILGPVLGGVITDLSSWRLAFVINLPLGVLAIWAMRYALPRVRAPSDAALDAVGIVLLAIGVAALQLFLARSVTQSWPFSGELLGEGAVAAAAFAGLVARAYRGNFGILRLAVFRDLNFALAAFYNFTSSALLFVIIVFVPALAEGPLGYAATQAGLTIVPRGVATVLMLLLVGRVIEKIDYRLLLAMGLALMAAGVLVLAQVGPRHAASWIIVGSTVQAAGGGAVLTCLSTVAFSTLAPELRTDAAGVYSLLRQLGCASGVAVMVALLHLKIGANLTALGHAGPLPAAVRRAAALRAYDSCFDGMAIATALLMPGIWLFRVRSPGRSLPEAA